MAQETQIGALYQPRGVGWGERWEGVSKGTRYMDTHGYYIEAWQKTTKFCKAIILQLKNKWIKKIERGKGYRSERKKKERKEK